jgi:negative regulator of replication initiation
MNSGNNLDRGSGIREKIVSQMRSIGNGPRKQITAKEFQNLKRAVSRLDQMLRAGAEADQQALKSAAERLDQLLSDIRTGKDVTKILRRPR